MFPTRLYWSHRRGVAACDGVRAEIHVRPDIPGLEEMTEMDYLPGMAATVRVRSDARRDMTPAEQAAAHDWLRSRAAGALDAFDGSVTTAVIVVHA